MRSSYNYPAGVTDQKIDEHFGEPEQVMDDSEYNEAVLYAMLEWMLEAQEEK